MHSCIYRGWIAIPIILGLLSLNLTAQAVFNCKYFWVEVLEPDYPEDKVWSDYYVGIWLVEKDDGCYSYSERDLEVDGPAMIARIVGTAAYMVLFFNL